MNRSTGIATTQRILQGHVNTVTGMSISNQFLASIERRSAWVHQSQTYNVYQVRIWQVDLGKLTHIFLIPSVSEILQVSLFGTSLVALVKSSVGKHFLKYVMYSICEGRKHLLPA